MKLLVLIIAFFFTLFSPPLLAQEQQVVVPYTLADRDRAILTEAKIASLEANMNLRFESQQRQLDDIKTLFYWGFGIIITLFIFMFGYMIWDRRTAMQPALLHASKAEANSSNLISTLREYARAIKSFPMNMVIKYH